MHAYLTHSTVNNEKQSTGLQKKMHFISKEKESSQSRPSVTETNQGTKMAPKKELKPEKSGT